MADMGSGSYKGSNYAHGLYQEKCKEAPSFQEWKGWSVDGGFKVLSHCKISMK